MALTDSQRKAMFAMHGLIATRQKNNNFTITENIKELEDTFPDILSESGGSIEGGRIFINFKKRPTKLDLSKIRNLKLNVRKPFT